MRVLYICSVLEKADVRTNRWSVNPGQPPGQPGCWGTIIRGCGSLSRHELLTPKYSRWAEPWRCEGVFGLWVRSGSGAEGGCYAGKGDGW